MDIPMDLQSVAKVSSRTRLSETTEAIRRLVLDGVVPTGGRLKDQELSLALGVSRATVREAVRQLVHEGILVHEPYKGLRVASLDDQSYLDLSEVRAALEVLGAQRVGAKLSSEIDAQLEAAMTRLRNARDMASFNEAHFGFHALLQRLAGNEVLEQTWHIIEKRARVVMRIDYEIDPSLDRVSPHAILVDAIHARDPETIARAVNEHVLASAQDRVRRRQAILNVTPDSHSGGDAVLAAEPAVFARATRAQRPSRRR
jgi:DNA-binding GntR family transcriptional regulator